jgi:hypothetical protein
MPHTLRLTSRHKRSKTFRRKHREKQTSLRSYYGTVTLPKGLRLYHASNSELCELPQSPVFFLTLHPSDWYYTDQNIAVMELQRDVTLVFLIGTIRILRLHSALNNLLNIPRGNIKKMETEYINTWLPYIRKEHLDGWLSSIESKSTIEFCIINDPGIFKLIECKPADPDWVNTQYTENGNLLFKNWGSIYPIGTHNLPVTISLHSRYKPQIEGYMARVEEEEPNGTTLYILLKNAHISYFDSHVAPVKWV